MRRGKNTFFRGKDAVHHTSVVKSLLSPEAEKRGGKKREGGGEEEIFRASVREEKTTCPLRRWKADLLILLLQALPDSLGGQGERGEGERRARPQRD